MLPLLLVLGAVVRVDVEHRQPRLRVQLLLQRGDQVLSVPAVLICQQGKEKGNSGIGYIYLVILVLPDPEPPPPGDRGLVVRPVCHHHHRVAPDVPQQPRHRRQGPAQPRAEPVLELQTKVREYFSITEKK